MPDRRSVFSATAATLSAVGMTVTGRRARAAIPGPPGTDVEPRGTRGRLERLPTLDVENREDFLTGFRTLVNRRLTRAAKRRAGEILMANGMDTRADIPLEDAITLLADDPIIGTRFRTWTDAQQLMWRNLMDEFHGNAEAYLAEMEAADNAGPGTLELNPGIEPAYTTHEIHMQPGGYVGDPFAGHVFHYGTNDFYMGANDQDEIHRGLANSIPAPTQSSGRADGRADGQPLRILDLGCSCGQLTVALKERFPDAEVWGIDIGGPMVRYAHMRAVDLGADVHFAQRLAEDTKFPDDHFDLVTSYILHHEVSLEASQQIVREAYRILRPGGVFYPMDFNTGANFSGLPTTAYEKLQYWFTYRWNHEVWWYEYAQLDITKEMEDAGFDMTADSPDLDFYRQDNQTKRRNVLGIKPA